MMDINFLPWRQDLYLAKLKKIKQQCLIALSLLGFVLFICHLCFKSETAKLITGNNNLKQELRDLQKKRDLLSRIEVKNDAINQLLNDSINFDKERKQNERLFSELSKIIPENVVLTDFVLSFDGRATLIGEIKSMQSIAEVMRNMANSNLFLEPILKEVINNELKHVFKIEAKFISR